MDISIEQLSDENQAVELECQSTRTIAGFWKRVAAFLLDSTLLGLMGLILGIFFYDLLAGMGPWGRLLGFFIALIYFGVLDSTLGKGQTLGKRLLKIEVVNKEGCHLPFWRSLLRYVVFGVPFFVNGWWLPASSFQHLITCILMFLIFGVGGSIIYLFIFNRRTRQSLHDLLVRAYVVKSISSGKVLAFPVWKPHIYLVCIFCSLILVVLVLPSVFVKNSFPELFELQSSIQDFDKVHNATAFVGKNWGTSNGERWENTYFESRVRWRTKPEDYEAAAEEIASIVLQKYPEAKNKDYLSILIAYGYDIGIASAWNNRKFVYSPSEWANLIENNNGEL